MKMTYYSTVDPQGNNKTQVFLSKGRSFFFIEAGGKARWIQFNPLCFKVFKNCNNPRILLLQEVTGSVVL